MSLLYQNDLFVLSQKRLPSVMGIDESGRGALAGPVVIAAVVLNYEDPIPALNDSKLLSVKKREALHQEILARAQAWQIVEIDAVKIDEINIRQASLLGFTRVYEALKEIAGYAMVDGRDLGSGINGEAVVKGDSRHACIAAASILAKVHRDSLMREMDILFPEYGFAAHKGYGTLRHYIALNKFGPCPTHRHSFRLS